MYRKSYGIIETKAPLHVGASSGEETGNLNLIFRDQFTQTGIIPGSSIRGRFRAEMRRKRFLWEKENKSGELRIEDNEQVWYGHESVADREDGGTTEALVKFEYASLVWLPVFCPGQPIIWVSCPRLLERYKQITGVDAETPKPYTGSQNLRGRNIQGNSKILFFNLGFLEVKHSANLSDWIPNNINIPQDNLVVVGDNDIAQIHDMALYRQSRVKLLDDMKKVNRGSFFNVEALPESSILIFPIALKENEKEWKPFGEGKNYPLYFGGLESIGFGRCNVTLGSDLA